MNTLRIKHTHKKTKVRQFFLFVRRRRLTLFLFSVFPNKNVYVSYHHPPIHITHTYLNFQMNLIELSFWNNLLERNTIMYVGTTKKMILLRMDTHLVQAYHLNTITT